MNALKFGAAGMLLAASMAGLALAHHSTAEFDYDTMLPLRGAVTEFRWVNPHSHIGLYVELEDGTNQTWLVECGNPAINSRRGWTRSSVERGDVVEMLVSPARDGRPYGTLRVMTLADGTRLSGVIGDSPTGASSGLPAPGGGPDNEGAQ